MAETVGISIEEVPQVKKIGTREMAELVAPTKSKALAGKTTQYRRFCSKAEEANFALDKCAELAGLNWETVLGWMRDKTFVDMWTAERIRLNEKMFGKSVELALGKKTTTEDMEGNTREVEVAPDGAMLRHLQNALDGRFAKKSTVEHTGSMDVHVRGALAGMSDAEKMVEIKRLLKGSGVEIDVTPEDAEIVS